MQVTAGYIVPGMTGDCVDHHHVPAAVTSIVVDAVGHVEAALAVHVHQVQRPGPHDLGRLSGLGLDLPQPVDRQPAAVVVDHFGVHLEVGDHRELRIGIVVDVDGAKPAVIAKTVVLELHLRRAGGPVEHQDPIVGRHCNI